MGDKTNETNFDRSSAILGAFFVFGGLIMMRQGYNAYKIGEMIPPTGKHGWMSGPEMMIAGAMFAVFGAGFLVNEVRKARQRK